MSNVCTGDLRGENDAALLQTFVEKNHGFGNNLCGLTVQREQEQRETH